MDAPAFLILVCVVIGFLVSIGVPASVAAHKLLWRPKEIIPKWNARQQSVEGFFQPEQVSVLFDVFAECWNEIIGPQDFKKIFSQLNLYWKKDPISLGQEYVINGKKVSKATGLTRTKKDVDVWIFNHYKETIDGKVVITNKKIEDIKISSTALAHELIHVALWHIEGDPDADHEDSLFAGWTKKHSEVERQTNLRLKQKGL
jgi:hypothetical protein